VIVIARSRQEAIVVNHAELYALSEHPADKGLTLQNGRRR
jgi:hypothetical protein